MAHFANARPRHAVALDVENAAFLLDQHRGFQHLGPFLAHRRQALYSFCDDDPLFPDTGRAPTNGDRKSTRLNSSHQIISYAVFCLKKKILALITSVTLDLCLLWIHTHI